MTEAIIQNRPPGRQWLNNYIAPGPIGSVGDVNMQPRFKHSTPNMPIRWDPLFSHSNEKRLGSNVTDGSHTNYDSGGGPARLLDTNWFGRRDFKTSNGWYYQNITNVDRTIMPTDGETPDYSWHNKIATNYEARHTGDLFLPLPGPYALGEGQVPVGGNGPVITNVVRPLGYPTDVPIVSGGEYIDNNVYDRDVVQGRQFAEITERQNYLNGAARQRVQFRPRFK